MPVQRQPCTTQRQTPGGILKMTTATANATASYPAPDIAAAVARALAAARDRPQPHPGPLPHRSKIRRHGPEFPRRRLGTPVQRRLAPGVQQGVGVGRRDRQGHQRSPRRHHPLPPRYCRSGWRTVPAGRQRRRYGNPGLDQRPLSDRSADSISTSTKTKCRRSQSGAACASASSSPSGSTNCSGPPVSRSPPKHAPPCRRPLLPAVRPPSVSYPAI